MIISLEISPDLKIAQISSSTGSFQIRAYSSADALRINIGRVATRGVNSPAMRPGACPPPGR
ncbi:TPA: hypothetical protein ACK3RG_003030, partial [Burkholderia cepacia]